MDDNIIETLAKAVVYTCMVLAGAAVIFLFAGAAVAAFNWMAGGAVMTVNETRAARMYIFGLEAIDRIMANCHMSRQEVLHAIAVYKAEHRNTHPECDHCCMRSGDRPCVWPKGVCGI